MITMPRHTTKAPGTRADRKGYLSPMAERWPGGSIADLLLWLDVEGSERWKKRTITIKGKLRPDGTRAPDTEKTATYCDHYAADLIEQACGEQLIGAWTWWNAAAEKRVRAGEVVTPVWNKTVIEYGAKGLHKWVARCGHEFGWTREKDAKSLQAEVQDRSTIGLILTPSHVAVVVPASVLDDVAMEARLRPPTRSGDALTSQAGSRNFMLSWESDWYARRTDTVFVWLDAAKLKRVAP
jgi:hypothetical protein